MFGRYCPGCFVKLKALARCVKKVLRGFVNTWTDFALICVSGAVVTGYIEIEKKNYEDFSAILGAM